MNDSWFKPILEATMAGPATLLEESMVPWVGVGGIALLLLFYAGRRAQRVKKSGKPTLSSMGLGYKNQRVKKTSRLESTAVLKEKTLNWLDVPDALQDGHSNTFLNDGAMLNTNMDTVFNMNKPDTTIEILNIEPWMACTEKKEDRAAPSIPASTLFMVAIEEPFVVECRQKQIELPSIKDSFIVQAPAPCAGEHNSSNTSNAVIEEPFEIVVSKSLLVEPVVPEPAVFEPLLVESVVPKPAVFEPLLVEPVVPKPAVFEPLLVEPVVPKPAVFEPLLVEPAVVIAQEEPLEITLDSTLFVEAGKSKEFIGASAHIVIDDTPVLELVAPFKLPLLVEPTIHKNAAKVMSTHYPLLRGLSLHLQESLCLSPTKWYRIEYVGQYNVACERDVYIEYLVQGYNNQAWYQVKDRFLSFSGLISAQHIYTAVNLNDYHLEFASSKPVVFDGLVYSPERNYAVESVQTFNFPWTRRIQHPPTYWTGVENPTWQSFASVLLHTFACLPTLRDSHVDHHLSSVLSSLVDHSGKTPTAFDFNTLPSNKHYWYTLHSVLCSNINLASTLVVTLRDLALLLEHRRQQETDVVFSSVLESLWVVEQRYADIWGSAALLKLQSFD